MKLFFLLAALLLSAFPLFAQKTSVLWSYQAEGAIRGSAARSHDTLFVGSSGKELVALDANSGAVLWKQQSQGKLNGDLVIDQGVLFAMDDSGRLSARSSRDGTLLWEFSTRGEQIYDTWDYFLSAAMVEGEVVFVGSGDSSVYALDRVTGKKHWEFKTEGVVHAKPIFHRGAILIGSFDGYFYSLDSKTGSLNWKFKTEGNPYFPIGEIQKAAVVYGNQVIFSSRDYFTYALDSDTGRLLWKKQEKDSWTIATPTVRGSRLWVGTSDSHRFFAYDLENQNENWAAHLPLRVYGEAVLDDDLVVFGCFNGILYGLDAKTGAEVFAFQTEASKANYGSVFGENGKFREDFQIYGEEFLASEAKILSLGSILSTPLVASGVLYFGDESGKFYAVRFKD